MIDYTVGPSLSELVDFIDVIEIPPLKSSTFPSFTYNIKHETKRNLCFLYIYFFLSKMVNTHRSVI